MSSDEDGLDLAKLGLVETTSEGQAYLIECALLQLGERRGWRAYEVVMSGPERYGNRALNNTEKRVVELVAQGLKNNEVAEAMGTTRYVVVNYLRVIYDKLGLWNRVELALWYESRKHWEK